MRSLLQTAQDRTTLAVELEIAWDKTQNFSSTLNGLEAGILDKQAEIRAHKQELLFQEASVREVVFTREDLKNEPARKAAYEHAVHHDPGAASARDRLGTAEGELAQLELERNQTQRSLTNWQFRQRNLEAQVKLLVGA